MQYPAEMTAQNIAEFEYEYNRMLDMERDAEWWNINSELQVLANKEQE